MTDPPKNLIPLSHAAQNRCFGCGPANPNGLHIEFLIAEDGTVVSMPTVADSFAGHPGYLHGGIIATLLDETMSKAVRARGITAMTRQMEVDFRRPVPSGVPIRLEGRVIRHDGRKFWTEAKILNTAGKELAEGKGLFVEVRAR
jgi:uncharacterized protein (TIGR00369 family)